MDLSRLSTSEIPSLIEQSSRDSVTAQVLRGARSEQKSLGESLYNLGAGIQNFLFAKECIPNFFYIIRKCFLKQLSSECQFIGKCFALTLQLRFQQLTRGLPDAGGAEEAVDYFPVLASL